MRQRAILVAVVVVGAAGLAGCADDGVAPASGGDAVNDTVDDTGSDGGTGSDTGGDTGTSQSPAPCDPATNAQGEPVACVAGRLVDADGAPIAGLKVSACTLQTCVVGDTQADGTYKIGKLPVEPHKIELLGQLRGYATMVFYQPVTAGVLSQPPRDIVMATLDPDATPWPPEQGGTITVAGGMLELSAAPDTIQFPLGTVHKEVLAAELDPLDLPPYDIEPWRGKEDGTRAFVLNPFPIQASESVGMVVHGALGVAAGAAYEVYTAHHLEARLELAGTATADGAGDITLDSDADLTTLTTILVVPR